MHKAFNKGYIVHMGGEKKKREGNYKRLLKMENKLRVDEGEVGLGMG